MKKYYTKILLVSYIAALIVSVPNRVYLALFHIDPSTGLYSGGGVLPDLFNLGLLIFILFWFATTLLRRAGRDYPIRFKCPVASALCALTGVMVLLCVVVDAVSAVIILRGGQIALDAWGAYLPPVPTIWNIIIMSIKVLSGILGALALLLFSLREDLGKLKVLGIFPAIWQILVLIERFTRFAAPTQISENLLSILFMVFAPIFLLGQSRTLSGLKPRDSRNYLIPAGFAASLVGFSLSVPGFIASIAGGSFSLRFEWSFVFNVYVLVFSLYTAVFLFNYIRAIRSV